MDFKFFGWFIGFTLLFELMIILPLLKTIKKIRNKTYPNKDDKVIAELKKVKHLGLTSSNEADALAIYEWIYKGKKRRLYVQNGGNSSLLKNFITIHTRDFSPTMEITVSKRTGKYKTPEGEKNYAKLIGFIISISFIIGYYLAIKVTGINPLID